MLSLPPSQLLEADHLFFSGSAKAEAAANTAHPKFPPKKHETCTSYWLEGIAHQGVSAFNANPSTYQVFRNVKDFGAKGVTRWPYLETLAEQLLKAMVSRMTLPPSMLRSALGIAALPVAARVLPPRPRWSTFQLGHTCSFLIVWTCTINAYIIQTLLIDH